VEGGDRKLLKRVILDVENYIIYLQLAIMNKEMMYLYSLLSNENYLDYHKGNYSHYIDKNDTDMERISIEDVHKLYLYPISLHKHPHSNLAKYSSLSEAYI